MKRLMGILALVVVVAFVGAQVTTAVAQEKPAEKMEKKAEKMEMKGQEKAAKTMEKAGEKKEKAAMKMHKKSEKMEKKAEKMEMKGHEKAGKAMEKAAEPLRTASPARGTDLGALDVSLTRSFLKLASHRVGGQVNPLQLPADWHIRQPQRAPAPGQSTHKRT